LTVLQEVDEKGKGSLITFLHGAGLIGAENPAVALTGATLRGAYLPQADLRGAHLRETNLPEAILEGANLQRARELTQEQIEWTIGLNNTAFQTKLPKGLNRPPLWSKSLEEQVKIIIEHFRHL
jgi:uncharacterized protein YjbI with pentapeptide repeats